MTEINTKELVNKISQLAKDNGLAIKIPPYAEKNHIGIMAYDPELLVALAEVRYSNDLTKIIIEECEENDFESHLQADWSKISPKYMPHIREIAKSLDSDKEIVQEVVYISKSKKESSE